MGFFYGEQEAKRKELKRAFAPELLAKLPSRRTRGKGKYGIRYSYNGIGRGHVFTRWYEKERGRDQAYRVMSASRKLPSGREFRLYKLLEKIDRINQRTEIGHGE